MPTIAESQNVDTSGYARIVPSVIPPPKHPENLLVQRNANQICSLPNLPGTFPSTDNVVGFGLAGKIPQWRAAIPNPNTTGSGGGTAVAATTIISTAGSNTTTNSPPIAKAASAMAPPLNPGQSFTGTVLMAKSFYLLNLSVNSPVRVELYSTSAARASDMSRSATTPPGYGNEQGLIGDFNLPNAPATWATDPAVIGGNGDSPQSNVIYLTITNISGSSATPAVTFSYVPLQA